MLCGRGCTQDQVLEISTRDRAAAVVIQTAERSRQAVSFYMSGHAGLWWRRARWRLAMAGQRAWRGHVGRRAARTLREVARLPDPADIRNICFWQAARADAGAPVRTLGFYEEYVFGGSPASWSERRKKQR